MSSSIVCNVPSQLKLQGNLRENFKRFKQSFEIYLLASGLDKIEDERKIAILLNCIGEEALEVYNTFKMPSLKKEKYDDVMKVFETYCNPKKDILHARFLFYSRKQNDGESFDSFLTEIKALGRNCEFTNEEELLRDKLVLGTNDNETRVILIMMGDISLKDAIEHLRLAEIRKVQARNKRASADSRINCTTRGKKARKNQTVVEKCPEIGKKCPRCGKVCKGGMLNLQ